ncbi:MAG: hypothetical protein HC880_15175 [Bacteroidia bacterium]|nr:hypothetical protein [Bacteroidia bacterium]
MTIPWILLTEVTRQDIAWRFTYLMLVSFLLIAILWILAWRRRKKG